MGTTVFRIRIELIFRRCCNLITPSRSEPRRNLDLAGSARRFTPGGLHFIFFNQIRSSSIASWCEKSKPLSDPTPMTAFYFLAGSPMAALVVHASKDGESTRTLFTSPVLTVAKARGLFKAGWQVHVVDANGGVFHPKNSNIFLDFLTSPQPSRAPFHRGGGRVGKN
jgi:hypothetical protein